MRHPGFTCVVCGKSFEANNSLARYCSNQCRRRAAKDRRQAELAALRDDRIVAIDKTTYPRCKDCKWWEGRDDPEYHYCGRVGSEESLCELDDPACGIMPTAKFGCIEWEAMDAGA